MHPGHGFKSYADVTTIGDLKDFVEGTIGRELYAARDDRGRQAGEESVDYDRYIFRRSIVPLGKMRLRQQRRQEIDCAELSEVN